MANLKALGLVILVVISFLVLLYGANYLFTEISPFDIKTNFIISFVVVLGFYVGAGFTFKKLKVF